MDEHRPKGINVSPLFVAIVGVLAGSIALSLLHWIILGFGIRNLTNRQQSLESRNQEQDEEAPSVELEHSMVQLIPVSKYSKGGAKTGTDDEAMCAVCLGEFLDGEQVRILPECTHSFHVPCIDMWLYSHSSCPLCRIDVTPLQRIVVQPQSEPERLPEFGG